MTSRLALTTNQYRFQHLLRQAQLAPADDIAARIHKQLPSQPCQHIVAIKQLITIVDPRLAHRWYCKSHTFVMVNKPIRLNTQAFTVGLVPLSDFANAVSSYLMTAYQLSDDNLANTIKLIIKG